MDKHLMPLFFFSILFLSSLSINFAGARHLSDHVSTQENSFTPKASLIQYWNKEIHANFPISSFLLSKVSPLSDTDSATFAKLAAQNKLSTQLSTFCSLANLFCSPNNYGNDQLGGFASNKYIVDESTKVNSLRQYLYTSDEPIKVNSLRKYVYVSDEPTKVNSLRKYVYSSDEPSKINSLHLYVYAFDEPSKTNSLRQYVYASDEPTKINSLSQYLYASHEPIKVNSLRQYLYTSDEPTKVNSLSQYFYASHEPIKVNSLRKYVYASDEPSKTNSLRKYVYASDEPTKVNSLRKYVYASDEPTKVNSLSQYLYASHEPIKVNSLRQYLYTYDELTKVNSLSQYLYASHEPVNVNSLRKYVYASDEPSKTNSLHKYVYASDEPAKINSLRQNYQNFAKKDQYSNDIPKSNMHTQNFDMHDTKGTSEESWVELGKFFRESMLKEGTMMEMPTIKDNMPKRSFLPRTIIAKMPFSTSKISELKHIFHADANSLMENIIMDTLTECERAPNPGETKKCVASPEDLIDFATSMLGHNILIHTTHNTSGSKQQVMIGSIKRMSSGNVTKSVSCHQGIYPYLLYYCHFVPKVRVYEVSILDPNSKEKINQGVAMCHLDTSQWSPKYEAFLALGSGPGDIEVCHWILENDLVWTTAE